MSTSSIRTASIPTRRSRRRWARSITAVRQGKALYAGISSYNSAAHRARRRRSCGRSARRCLIHQPSYSMLNRWVEDDGLLDTLESEGIGCIAFSPLAQGMLTDKYLDGIPEDSRAAQGSRCGRTSSTRQRSPTSRALNEIAERRGQTLAQMALAWVLRDGARHLGADRREPARAGRGLRRRAGEPRFQRRRARRDRPLCRARATSICGPRPRSGKAPRATSR